MGVLTNGFRDTIGVFRTYGGTASNNCYPYTTLGNYARTGMMRNITAGEGITDDHVGVPMGYADRGWVMPQKGGMISARTTGITLSASGAGLLGLPSEGSASFSINFADAAGQLIVSGAGTASFTVSTNTPLLTASIGGSGAASFTISASGLLGAEASGAGSASFTISAAGSILPLDDTPPARTASATFTIGGTLTPYAVGHMAGSTEGGGELTEATIASAVWSAAAASNTTTGTMGELLNGAGGGSSPGAVADAVWVAASRSLTTLGSGITTDIANAVRAALAVELARIDAAVTTRQAAGTVNANVTSVNGIAIDGAGTELNPWGPV